MTEALTPDATRNGVPLSPPAYAASLRLLAEFARGPVSALRATTLDWHESDAWVALQQCGIVREMWRHGLGDFRWIDLVLTRYGRVYAEQRGIDVR